MSTEDPRREEQVRARQRGRSVATALVLAAFVILMYLITIARMS